MDYSKGLEYRETDGYALLAQLVEHLHGKEGVTGSNPVGGSLRAVGAGAKCACLTHSPRSRIPM